MSQLWSPPLLILSAIDSCTHASLAVHIKRNTAEEVAEALVLNFTKLLVPSELVCDNVCEFSGTLHKVVCKTFFVYSLTEKFLWNRVVSVHSSLFSEGHAVVLQQ